VKVVKWLLIGSICLLGSASWVRGDAAGDLYNQGASALQNEQYDVAAKAFDTIITGYPTSPNIDEVRIRAGYAYFCANKYTEAVDRLSKEAAANAKPSTAPRRFIIPRCPNSIRGKRATTRACTRKR